jgi:hypothetical protein
MATGMKTQALKQNEPLGCISINHVPQVLLGGGITLRAFEKRVSLVFFFTNNYPNRKDVGLRR